MTILLMTLKLNKSCGPSHFEKLKSDYQELVENYFYQKKCSYIPSLITLPEDYLSNMQINISSYSN
ncbi:hypothetical protein T01_7963 [Trichinella spiralis]|uniref:Uncharacterized protein n=1 Tax=Trichinella spiralis TaxID=6334 RepID=A0A0V1B015_TRISP|nr:hypothetical protein T01_7963 [Trichinella spiralis]